jgi:multidrug resistance efflux pump
MKVIPEAVEISSGTEIIPAVESSVREKDIATLNNYAEKKFQETTQLSEVMSTVPPILQRGGIYLISTAVGLTSILLYFSKVPIWVEASGSIVVPQTESLLMTAPATGVVTVVGAKTGQRLAKNATLLKIEPAKSQENRAIAFKQLQTWQTLQQMELQITQEKIELAKIELRLKYQNKVDRDRPDIANLTQKIEQLETEIATLKTKIDHPVLSTAQNTVVLPEAGTIAQLKVNQPGQLVSQGNIVATVIPDRGRLIVESTIGDRDLAAVKPGMIARVKVSAYDFREFGTIPAQVREVTPQLNRPGEFKVALDLLVDKLTQDGEVIALQPGLNVQVEMQTQKKRLLQLLFSK